MSNATACPVTHDELVNLRRALYHAMQNSLYSAWANDDYVFDRKRDRKQVERVYPIAWRLGQVGEPVVDVAESVDVLRGRKNRCRYVVSYLWEYGDYVAGWASDCRHENGYGPDHLLAAFWEGVRDSIPEAVRTVKKLAEWERAA